ncbi:MAG: thiolase domain-containing protein [Verrucomicrobiae bacterium]|nr:thiolase domain-containing protein [Verrucomicrobiae bacterium]
MLEPVYLFAAARSDFKRNFKKEGKSLRQAIPEMAREVLAAAELAPREVQSAIVGNFAGGMFSKQLHLGSCVLDAHPDLVGIPTLHVEAACASGATAVLTAAQQIMGGLHDVVLVVGAEQQKTMPPLEVGEVLAAAGDVESERAQYGEYLFPKLFARVAELYRQRFALSEEDLARVSVKNIAHAQANPLAQTRGSPLSMADAMRESEKNPRFAPPLKITDCSQITDGAAALVLCSEAFWKKRRGPATGIRLAGFGQTTDRLQLAHKDVPTFAMAQRAAHRAFSMAGSKPTDLHGVDVHDCFSISEIIAYEILGLAEPGNGPKLLASGATALPTARAAMGAGNPTLSIPVNPGGGLIGDGHPVGATGVRQVAECFSQLSGTAGARQIEGARRYLTFNMGGSFTTSVVMIWEKE